jgi:hypothetical protein
MHEFALGLVFVTFDASFGIGIGLQRDGMDAGK